MVAETFLTAWRRLERIPPGEGPWLLGVARRTLANHRRSGRRREALATRLTPELRTALAAERDPGHQESERSDLARALRRLRDEDREALMLVAWEGLDNKQAAAAMECSPETFAVRLHRARRRLAKELMTLEGEWRSDESLSSEPEPSAGEERK